MGTLTSEMKNAYKRNLCLETTHYDVNQTLEEQSLGGCLGKTSQWFESHKFQITVKTIPESSTEYKIKQKTISVILDDWIILKVLGNPQMK